MPPKRKGKQWEQNRSSTAKKLESETPTISPDKGATGETVTSSKTMEAGTQTGWLSKINTRSWRRIWSTATDTTAKFHYFFRKWRREESPFGWDECNAIMGMMNSLQARDPEAYQDIVIGTLYKQFARENRATRSKELIFRNLTNWMLRRPSIWRPLAVCLIG